jgi:hypothetical protein
MTEPAEQGPAFHKFRLYLSNFAIFFKQNAFGLMKIVLSFFLSRIIKLDRFHPSIHLVSTGTFLQDHGHTAFATYD